MNLTSPTPHCIDSTSMMTSNKETLVRPNQLLLHLLKSAGAQKETFTMKEVIYHLGQYIMAKQLYDEKQQHIVHCSNDPLGELFGVQNFSVKEPRRLYAMISKNLVVTDSQESLGDALYVKDSCVISQTPSSQQDSEHELNEKFIPVASSSSSPKKNHSESEENSSNDQPTDQQRKRHKSDSISLTFDESLSWWVISGLRSDRNNSDSTDTSSNAEPNVRSDDSDSDSSDQFSVEFEVESVYSEDYSPSGDDESITDIEEDDEVYQVTIYQAEDNDSFEDDSEISDADYWKCSKCGEMNPPIPRYCNRCWSLRKDWLPEEKEEQSKSMKRKEMEDTQEDEGIDVPDGKKQKLEEPPEPSSIDKKDDEGIQSSESQEMEDFSQPSTSWSMASGSQEEPKLGAQGLACEDGSERSMPLTSIDPCVICQTRPKNGCIVHGKTGHLMACFSCAKKLKKRNKPCPVCRQPIQMIVLTYFS